MSEVKKVVIITGGTSGIGLACAVCFLENNYRVLITGRNRKKLEEAEKKLNSLGDFLPEQDFIVFQADVSLEEDCKKTIEKTIKTFGRIDILINNAGVSMRALFRDLELEIFKKIMQINFYGTVYMTKYALDFLIKTQGTIVGISSTAGKIGLPARTAYCASKAAMVGFLSALACEYQEKLHVLRVYPGFTASNIRIAALTANGTEQGFSPLQEKNIMSAEDVAQAIFKAIQKKKKNLILGLKEKLAIFLQFFFPDFIEKQTYQAMYQEENSPLLKLEDFFS